MKWFRFYHDLPGDIKLTRFTAEEKWAWVCLLCLASQGNSRGVIRFDDDDIAAYCGFTSTQDWICYRDKLISKNMIKSLDDGALKITHWEEQQHFPVGGKDCSYRQHQQFVFERDGFACVYCGRQDSLTLDHVIPQSKGGSHDRENLVTCCSTCNSSKGARTPQEWLGEN